VDIDIGAHFSYLAQKGMAWGLSMCERLHCSLGFVIEGQVVIAMNMHILVMLTNICRRMIE
jgi:hypothetical protein